METFSTNFLITLGLLTLSLFIVGYISKFLKIPSVVFFILIGILFGKFVHQDKTLENLSEIGIVLLFFYLGLEFNITRAISVAKKIWTVGLLDIFFNFIVITLLMYILGYSFIISLLTGAVAYASSSAITSKIIIEEKRIANPETEMILGLMVFEDIIAPILLAILAGNLYSGNLEGVLLGIILFKILAILSFVFFISMVFKEKLKLFIEKILEEDIFILFAFGSVIAFAGFTHFLGLSEALGAFLIGMIISETGKSEDVEKSLISIKDLAVAIFFFLFGANIVFDEKLFTDNMIITIIIVSIISVIGKFLTGYIGGLIYGLSKRSSIVAGLTIVNRGEFSIVISKLSPVNFVSFYGVYVLIMAFVGILLAQYSVKISKLIIKPKKKV